MRKIKKCIGLLLAIALAGNLCAVNIPVSEVYAQEVEEQTNDVQSAGSYYDVTLIAVRREKNLRFLGGFSLFLYSFMPIRQIIYLTQNEIPYCCSLQSIDENNLQSI